MSSQRGAFRQAMRVRYACLTININLPLYGPEVSCGSTGVCVAAAIREVQRDVQCERGVRLHLCLWRQARAVYLLMVRLDTNWVSGCVGIAVNNVPLNGPDGYSRGMRSSSSCTEPALTVDATGVN